ncbi:MAG: EF-P lysine aminoacylase GenX [Gammaproteobacteria bacterium]|nr:EF-P lysine aminoacylase GenX [Gammaproteobacteria bacterium]
MTNHDWKPGASLEMLERRNELLQQIRAFFLERGVMEVETPLLSGAGNSDPGIEQFALEAGVAWLRTSPEYAMKRLLAAGSGDIFELGRVFRDGEQGRHHNREFTMLEWYRCGWTLFQLMDEVGQLVRAVFCDEPLTETRISYRDLFLAYTGTDPLLCGTAELGERATEFGLDVPGLDRDGLLDLLLSHVIQPKMKTQGMVFVHDYPPSQAALAQIREGDPAVAERFELFLDGIELANGYHELADAGEQRQRFELENRRRGESGRDAAPIDQNLLGALQAGLPDCCGVALGFDRLLMRLLGVDDLDQVIPFTSQRA